MVVLVVLMALIVRKESVFKGATVRRRDEVKKRPRLGAWLEFAVRDEFNTTEGRMQLCENAYYISGLEGLELLHRFESTCIY